MGRYDKIKVYDGSTWKQPSQIRVYQNGAWVTLGTNDSDNTKSLSVRKDNNFVRATLNKTITVVPGDYYTVGNGFALTKTDSSGRLLRYCVDRELGDWYFRATIRKTSDTAMNVFYLGKDGSHFVKITWNANGTITATNYSTYQGEEYSVTTTNAVGANQWVYLNVTSAKGTAKVTINFNGVETKGNFYGVWYYNGASYKVGQTGLQFKSTMSIQGRDYYNGLVSVAINMSNSSDVANNCSGASVSYDGKTVESWT
jgi:hypothetical protein